MYFTVMDVARLNEHGLVKVELSAHAVAGPFRTYTEEREAREKIEDQVGPWHGIWFGQLYVDEEMGGVPPVVVDLKEALESELSTLPERDLK